jgi:tol-pal system protein YbgF
MDSMKTLFITFFLIFFILPQTGQAARIDILERDLKELKGTSTINNKKIARALSTFDQIQLDMQSLRGQFDENQHFQKEDANKIQQHLNEIDLRLSGLEERLALFMDQMRDWALNPPSKTKGSEVMRLAYQKAFSEMSVGHFEESMRLFDKFIVTYPKSSLTDNAQYWKAECVYALKDYQQSILEFQKVVKNYPESNKIADSILKQGYSFFELKSYLESRAFLQKVVTNHPQTESAVKAQKKLAQIEAMVTSPEQAPSPVPAKKTKPLPKKKKAN